MAGLMSCVFEEQHPLLPQVIESEASRFEQEKSDRHERSDEDDKVWGRRIAQGERNDRRGGSDRPVGRRVHPHAPDVCASNHGSVVVDQNHGAISGIHFELGHAS